MLKYFADFLNLLIIVAMIWYCLIIVRLLVSKEYRKYPPFVPSFGNEKKILIEKVRDVLKKSKKELVILDPGCGTGTLLLKLSKEFPNHKFVGIEWNKIVAKICAVRAWGRKNFQVICDDMFKHDFGQADIVVCFLMPEMLDKFSQKLMKDHKKEQIIFSNSFQIPNLDLIEEVKTGKGLLFKNIYIYKL